MATEIKLNIKMPDELTVGIWSVYNGARLKYQEQQTEKKELSDPLIGRFLGALALIKNGYVRLEGLDKLTQVLERADMSSIGLRVMGFIVNNISLKIEAELDAPLPDYLLASSNIDKTPSDMNRPKH